MLSAQFTELLLQSLEHERGGVKLYENALKCVQREDLRGEWRRYLAQTEQHVEVLTDICEYFDLDPFTTTPGTQVVKALANSLVAAVQQALTTGSIDSAEIVAAECIVLAETKDHLNWELIREAAGQLTGDDREVVARVCGKIEDEEDQHLYHTQGWCRELWFDLLGIKAQLPPPEDVRDVMSAAEAQSAKESRLTRH